LDLARLGGMFGEDSTPWEMAAISLGVGMCEFSDTLGLGAGPLEDVETLITLDEAANGMIIRVRSRRMAVSVGTLGQGRS